MRDAVERQRAMAPPWPGDAEPNREPGIPSNVSPPGRSFPERPARVDSPELNACAARYERYRRELDRYEREAPEYIMIRTTVGKEPERVSCSRVKSYARMGGGKGELYRQYLGRCMPLPTSGEVYEAAKAKVEETHRGCLSIARRAGIPPGEARSLLR